MCVTGWSCSADGCDKTGGYERILQKLVGPDNRDCREGGTSTD